MTLPDILNVKNALVNVVHHWQPCCNFCWSFYICSCWQNIQVYTHRHRQVSTVTQSQRRALSVELIQVSAFPTLQPKYGKRTICRKVVFFSMYKSCVVFYIQGNRRSPETY